MTTRVQNAMHRAAQLDRAETTLKEVNRIASNAYAVLLQADPETAAVVARVVMMNKEALERLAKR